MQDMSETRSILPVLWLRYQVWWFAVAIASLVTAIMQPLEIAFYNAEAFGSGTAFWTTFELLVSAMFLADMIMK